MYNFFSPDETELKQVIQETLEGQDTLINATTIQTGWTNITMDVHGELKDYIFRFPRNLFFAKMMVKDCAFCNLLQGKIKTPIPNMHLKTNKNRPFSVHQKIIGVSLGSVLDTLSDTEQLIIADELGQFLTELHSLPVDIMPADITESLSDFLSGLATVHQGDYDLSKHDSLRIIEEQIKTPYIIHGDFHPNNVLIHNGHVSGIIDFSFASVSDFHSDLGRFMGRSNPILGNLLIESYANKTHRVCDTKKIQDVVDVFKYVEYKYVQYMQSNHPEIKIPESVLKTSALMVETAA